MHSELNALKQLAGRRVCRDCHLEGMTRAFVSGPQAGRLVPLPY